MSVDVRSGTSVSLRPYPELRARKALHACAPKNVWSACEWLKAHKGDADIDAPIRRVPACVETSRHRCRCSYDFGSMSGASEI